MSASFIRPGRLSDSAASDEHHEETLDTTAFSMHYRSLARSESGELKTPTAVRLVFEEKTKDSNPTGSGNSMALTEIKKLGSQSLVVPSEKVRVGEDSDDMSIVDANPNTYDYGRLSPTLDALLAESSKDLNAESVSVSINSKSPMQSEVLRSEPNGTSHVDNRNGRDSELGNFGIHENYAEAASFSHIKLGQENGGSLDQIAFDDLFRQNNGLTASVSNHVIQSPNKLISVRQQEFIFTTPNSASHSDMASPSLKWAELQSNDYMNHDQSILSMQKSGSSLRVPHHSYSGSSIKQGIDNLKRRLSKYSSLSSPYGGIHDEDVKELLSENVGAPIACLEEQLLTADLKNEDRSLVSIKINDYETPTSTSKLVQNKEIAGLVKDGEPLHSMSMGILSKDKSCKLTTPLSSRVQLASSGRKVMQLSLISEDSANKMLFTSGNDSALAYDHGTDLPHMPIACGTLQNVQSPRDKVILNIQLESSEKNSQIGTKSPLSSFYGSGTNPRPNPLKVSNFLQSFFFLLLFNTHAYYTL